MSPRALRIVLVAFTLTFASAASGWDFVQHRATGLPANGITYGGTWIDLDGDDAWDLVLSRHATHLEIYRGKGFGFEGPLELDLPGGLLDHHGSAACDHDGDGTWDLYLTTGADRGASESCKHLWIQEEPQRFVEAFDCAHVLADPTGRGRGALWLRLDASPAPQLFLMNFETPARLFDRRDGAWRDGADRLPADAVDVTAVAVDDFDADGDVDMVVGGAQTRAWHNVDGVLTSVDGDFDAEVGPSFDLASGDVDGDGRVDLLVVHRGARPRVWRNAGGVSFAGAAAMDVAGTAVSVALADLDNDGSLDAAIARRDSRLPRVAPVLLRGRGDGSFDPAEELNPVPSVAMAVWAIDLDRDGDLDLVFLNGEGQRRKRRGGWPRGNGTTVVYENRTTRRGFTVELAAPADTAPHGMGATVTLHGADGSTRRQRVRATANPWNSTILPVHFGTGDATGPFTLTIDWPHGVAQRVEIPASGAAWRVAPEDAVARRIVPRD